MTLVLDGSLALDWCFEDEESEPVERLRRQVTGEGAYVPAIWRLEVCNGLLVGVRRKRMTLARAAAAEGLATLP